MYRGSSEMWEILNSLCVCTITHLLSLLSDRASDEKLKYSKIDTNRLRTKPVMVRKGRDTTPMVEEHPGGGHIVVTAQQSRYALDAVDAPASKEVHNTLPFPCATDLLLMVKDTNQGPVHLGCES